MILKRSVVILIALVVSFCFGCRENNREVEDVINIINKNFGRINNYVADYSIKEGNDLIFVGKITFIKPETTRLEILNPQTKKLQNIIYSNSNFKYSYFPQWNEAIKGKLVKKTDKKYGFIYHSIANEEEILSLTYNGMVKIGQEDLFKLTATMGDKKIGGLTNIYTFFVTSRTGCIRKFSYRDHKTGKEVTYEFENYKINIKINRREVELNLPSDTRITELD